MRKKNVVIGRMQTQFPKTRYNLRSDVDSPIPVPPGEDLPTPVQEPPDKPVLEPDNPVREPEPTEPTRL